MEAAEDPTAIFEATADLIEAMCSAGASPQPSAGHSACSTALPTFSDGSPAQQDSLARTLCAALSEPLLKHRQAPSASLASVSVSAASPQTQHSQHGRAFAGGASMLHLQHSYSAPQGALDTPASEALGRTASLTALSGDSLHMTQSLSTASAQEGASAQVQQPAHPARSAHSSMQLQELLHMHSLQLQRRQQQQQQQQALSQERVPLQQLLVQQLLQEDGMFACQQQDTQQQQLLLLFLQQQQRQQQCQQEQEDRRAVLLARLKHAIAVTAARNRLGLQ